MSKRIRITFEVPETLLEFIDDECKKKSTEIMKWSRSNYLRQLIIEARDGKKEVRQQKPIIDKYQNNKSDMSDSGFFDDLLNMTKGD